jgi:hypothetical protein
VKCHENKARVAEWQTRCIQNPVQNVSKSKIEVGTTKLEKRRVPDDTRPNSSFVVPLLTSEAAKPYEFA